MPVVPRMKQPLQTRFLHEAAAAAVQQATWTDQQRVSLPWLQTLVVVVVMVQQATALICMGKAWHMQ